MSFSSDLETCNLGIKFHNLHSIYFFLPYITTNLLLSENYILRKLHCCTFFQIHNTWESNDKILYINIYFLLTTWQWPDDSQPFSFSYWRAKFYPFLTYLYILYIIYIYIQSIKYTLLGLRRIKTQTIDIILITINFFSFFD